MLERALDIVNKWPRDIGDRWRQNLIKDVVSVVVTVVIVNTVKPLPLIPSSVFYYTTCGGAEYTSELRSAVVLSDAEVLIRSSAVVGFSRSALAGAAVDGSARFALAWLEAVVGLARTAPVESAAVTVGFAHRRGRV